MRILRTILPLLASLAVILVSSTALADIPVDDVHAGPSRMLVLVAFAVIALGAVVMRRPDMLRRAALAGFGSPYRLPAPREASVRPRPRAKLALASGVLAGVLAFGAVSTSVMVTTGCGAAANATAVADLGAIATAAGNPLPCTIVTAIDGTQAGTICGTVQTTVEGVVAIIQGILKSLPSSAAPAAVAVMGPPVTWSVGGVTINLRADVAGPVRDAIRVKANLAPVVAAPTSVLSVAPVASAAPVAPVAPVASAAPVAPVATVAPTAAPVAPAKKK
jgi:Meckel syndrome type 1 protein